MVEGVDDLKNANMCVFFAPAAASQRTEQSKAQRRSAVQGRVRRIGSPHADVYSWEFRPTPDDATAAPVSTPHLAPKQLGRRCGAPGTPSEHLRNQTTSPRYVQADAEDDTDDDTVVEYVMTSWMSKGRKTSSKKMFEDWRRKAHGNDACLRRVLKAMVAKGQLVQDKQSYRLPDAPPAGEPNQGGASRGPSRPAGRHRPFEAAREYARQLGLPSRDAWRAYWDGHARPHDIPGSPENIYKADSPGWLGWADFLGHGHKQGGARGKRKRDAVAPGPAPAPAPGRDTSKRGKHRGDSEGDGSSAAGGVPGGARLGTPPAKAAAPMPAPPPAKEEGAVAGPAKQDRPKLEDMDANQVVDLICTQVSKVATQTVQFFEGEGFDGSGLVELVMGNNEDFMKEQINSRSDQIKIRGLVKKMLKQDNPSTTE